MLKQSAIVSRPLALSQKIIFRACLKIVTNAIHLPRIQETIVDHLSEIKKIISDYPLIR